MGNCGMTIDGAAARPRTRRSREARVEEILETAARLFAARGYRNTSMTSVAHEIGLTDAGVHHHFPTKRDLLFAVLDWDDRNGAVMFEELLEPGGMTALRNIARWGHVMDERHQMTGLHIALSAEALDGEAPLHPYFVRRYRIVRAWFSRAIEQAIADGDIDPAVNPEVEAMALVALLDGLRLHWFFTDGSRSIADLVGDAINAALDRISTAPR
jgi:AcrR family transcriptional regulator